VLHVCCVPVYVPLVMWAATLSNRANDINISTHRRTCND